MQKSRKRTNPNQAKAYPFVIRYSDQYTHHNMAIGSENVNQQKEHKFKPNGIQKTADQRERSLQAHSEFFCAQF